MKNLAYTITGTINIPKQFSKIVRAYTYMRKDRGDFIPTPAWTVHKGILSIPRNMSKFWNNITKKDLAFNLVDLRTDILMSNNKNLSSDFKRRDYQITPTNDLLEMFNNNKTDVLLQAETGFGKTTVLPYIITNLNRKTLIVTDRKLLNEQMLSSITKFSDLSISELSKNINIDEFDVITTTFQFCNRNYDFIESISDKFGLLVIDEVHIIGAKSYLKLLSIIRAKFRLGLSATPTRSDGLNEILTDTLEYKVIGKNPNKLVPIIHMLDYEVFAYINNMSFKKGVGTFLVQDVVTSLVIPKIVDAVKVGRKLFLVVDIQDTQEFYTEALNKLGINAKVINAKTKDRQLYFDGIEDGSIDVLVGFAVLEKGVDIPRLDTIFHLNGMTTKEKIVQTIGRISREHPEKKEPMVIDFSFQGVLVKSGERRYQVYKNLKDTETIKFEYKYIQNKGQ